MAWIAGRPAIAWYGGHLAHETLFLQFADLRGRPAGRLLQLTDATRDAFEPSLQDLDGDALVGWYEQEPAAETGPPRQVALLARFDASGRRLWQRQLSSPGANGRIPVVRVAAQVIHAAWIEQRAGEPPVLRVARLDGNGAWLQSPRDAAPAGAETWNLNAAVDARGAMHVVYDSGTPGERKQLQWVIADDASAIRRSIEPGPGDAVFPDIAVRESRYALTWVDSRDGNDEVYLRCGELVPPPVESASFPARDARPRRVTRTPGQSTGAYATWDGQWLELAWVEVRRAGRELWRQRFRADCSPASRARRVADARLSAGIPSLARSGAGLALAWNGLRGSTSVVRLQVWPRRISPGAAAR